MLPKMSVAVGDIRCDNPGHPTCYMIRIGPDRYYLTFGDMYRAIVGPGAGVVVASDGIEAGFLQKGKNRLNFELVIFGRYFTINRGALISLSHGNQRAAEVRESRVVSDSHESLSIVGVI